MKATNKTVKNWHTPKSSKGMGDNRGSGIKAKMGKIVEMYPVDGFNQSPKMKGTPPKSLA